MANNKLNITDIPKIKQLREGGYSLRRSAKELGVTATTLAKFMRRQQLDTSHLPNATFDIPALVEAYNSGATLTQLHRETGRDSATVRKALITAGVTIRQEWVRNSGTTRMKELPLTEIAEAYQAGQTLEDLANKFGAAPATLRKCVLQAGVELRGKGARRKTAEEKEDIRLRRVYGISLQESRDLLAAQAGLCAICAAAPNDIRNHGRATLCLDHCHVTGRVRGYLCHTCNMGLSYFQDKAELLAKAADYVSTDR